MKFIDKQGLHTSLPVQGQDTVFLRAAVLQELFALGAEIDIQIYESFLKNKNTVLKGLYVNFTEFTGVMDQESELF